MVLIDFQNVHYVAEKFFLKLFYIDDEDKILNEKETPQ